MNAFAAGFAIEPPAMTTVSARKKAPASDATSFADMVDGSSAAKSPRPPREPQARPADGRKPDTDRASLPDQDAEMPGTDLAPPQTAKETPEEDVGEPPAADNATMSKDPAQGMAEAVAAVLPVEQPLPGAVAPTAEPSRGQTAAASSSGVPVPAGEGMAEDMAGDLLAAATGRPGMQVTAADKAQTVVSQPSSLLHAGNQVLTAMAGDGPGQEAMQGRGKAPKPEGNLPQAGGAAPEDSPSTSLFAQQAKAGRSVDQTVERADEAPAPSPRAGQQPEVNRPAIDILGSVDDRPATPPPSAGATAASPDVEGGQQTAATHKATLPRQFPSQAILDQVAVHISKAVREGVDGIRIQLRPESLGQLEVNLEVNRDGRVTAQVTVDNQDTLDLLQRDARGLERALQEAGLKTEAGSLNFNLRGENRPGQERHPARGSGRGTGTAAPLSDPAAPSAAASMRAAAGGIDIRV